MSPRFGMVSYTRRRLDHRTVARFVMPLPAIERRALLLACRCGIDKKSRVRGRILIAQEHQPLPSEQCLHVSMHTALQEPLQVLFSRGDTPGEKAGLRACLTALLPLFAGILALPL